eukprot:scaffold118917_cov26-Tisochrysis_lutea.AAC.2
MSATGTNTRQVPPALDSSWKERLHTAERAHTKRLYEASKSSGGPNVLKIRAYSALDHCRSTSARSRAGDAWRCWSSASDHSNVQSNAWGKAASHGAS